VAHHKTVNDTLQNRLIPLASNSEIKDLLTTGLKTFEGHEQHAEHGLAVQTFGVLLLAIVAGPTRADVIRVSSERRCRSGLMSATQSNGSIRISSRPRRCRATATGIPANKTKNLVLKAEELVDY
jgi:hypothetical protein